MLHKAPFTQDHVRCATVVRPQNWPGLSMVGKLENFPFLCKCSCNHCASLERSKMKIRGVYGATSEPPVCLHRAFPVQPITKGRSIQPPLCLLCAFSVPSLCHHWRPFSNVSASYTIIVPLRLLSDRRAFIVQPFCLLWATVLRPVSLATLRRLFWTCSIIYGVHADVWTSCVPPLDDLGNHSASPEPPLSIHWRSWMFFSRRAILNVFWS